MSNRSKNGLLDASNDKFNQSDPTSEIERPFLKLVRVPLCTNISGGVQKRVPKNSYLEPEFSVHELIMTVRRIVRDQISWYAYCFFWYIFGGVLKISVHNVVHVPFFWYGYHFFWYAYNFRYTYQKYELRTKNMSHVPDICTRN